MFNINHLVKLVNGEHFKETPMWFLFKVALIL